MSQSDDTEYTETEEESDYDEEENEEVVYEWSKKS